MSKINLCKLSFHLTLLSIFLIPFYFLRFSVLGIPTNIFEFFVLLALLAFALGSSKSSINLQGLWHYLFLLTAFIGVIASDDKTKALGMLKGWFIVPFILYFLIINLFNQQNFVKVSWSIFASTLVVAIWAILQRLSLIGLLFYQKADPASFGAYFAEGRVFGPFESPNYLAMFLVPALALSLPILLSLKKRQSQILAGCLFLLPVVALLLSKSRGGLLACGLMFMLGAYLGYRSLRVERNSLSWRFIVAFLALIGATFIFSDQVLLLYDPIRVDIYKYSLDLLKLNYLWGLGLGDFQDKIGAITSEVASFQTYALAYALHPHNLYLSLWLNLGLAGLAAFIALVYKTGRLVEKLPGSLRLAVSLALLGILIHGAVDTTYFKNDLSALFWLTLALSDLKKLSHEKYPA